MELIDILILEISILIINFNIYNMRILRFNQINELNTSSNLITVGKILNIQFNDFDSTSNIQCKMIEHGYAPNRSVIYYRFLVIKSDSDKYLVNSEFILPLDFDGKTIKFLMYPYINEKGTRTMMEKIYKAKCSII